MQLRRDIGFIFCFVLAVLLVMLLSSAFYYQAPNQGLTIDRSGSVTVGGTSQTLVGANTSRKRIVIENPCSTTTEGIAATENLFIDLAGGTASTSNGTSVELQPCGSFDSGNGPVMTNAITVNAATSSHRWIAKETQ